MKQGLIKLPTHVGIIMDGNGRWANQRGLPRVEGHRVGAKRAKEIIRASKDLGIKYLTLYAFSVENWQRPKPEVTIIMKLLELYLRKELGDLKKEGVRFKGIGELWKLPENIRKLLKRNEEDTKDNTTLTLTAALSYGGRDEIVRAVKKAISSGMKEEDVTEESFEKLLDTEETPPPDLIIRTSGERRMSNFLLWQSAYAELYFTDTLWPDFDREEYMHALHDYQLRERRFGGLTAKP